MIAFFKHIAGIAMVAAIMAFVSGAGHAQAGAVSGAYQASQNILPQMPSMVQKVHGCHRSPRIVPWSGLRHRHAGPACAWVRVKKRNICRRWRRICSNRCLDRFYPNRKRVRRCARRCFAQNAPDRCF